MADGAISFYLDHHVSARIARRAYGVGCVVDYDAKDAEHRRRSSSIYISVAGDKILPDAFDVILPKVRGVVVVLSLWLTSFECRASRYQKRQSFEGRIQLPGRNGLHLSTHPWN